MAKKIFALIMAAVSLAVFSLLCGEQPVKAQQIKTAAIIKANIFFAIVTS